MANALQPLILFGASALPEIVEVVRDINEARPTYRMEGVLDDAPAFQGQEIEGLKVLGPLEMARQFPDAQFVLGIGSYRTRIARFDIVRRLGIPMERYAALVHPRAKIYRSAKVGHGCILHANTVIYNNTTLEDLVVILSNTMIGSGNRLCEGCLLAGGVHTTGGVTIGHYSHIGLGSLLGENVRIGPGAQIAMGSTIFKDVPPGAFAMGNPPRLLDKIDVPEELLARWGAMEKQSGGARERR